MNPELTEVVLGSEAEAFLPNLVQGSICFVAFLVVAIIARAVLRRLLFRLRVDRSVVLLVSNGLFYTVLVLGLITGLGTMGVNVSALVASLGLGGFALGFALRDAISNVLAGTLILIYRPFEAGQHITVAGFEGTVGEINLRYTVLHADDGRHLIPNQLLFTNPVKVHGPPVPPPPTSSAAS